MDYTTFVSLKEEDDIEIEKKRYKIVFSPKHALHVCENYDDGNHRINHTEIRSAIKKGGILIKSSKKEILCITKFNSRIYIIPSYILGNNFFVKTAYICTNIELILIYQSYEYQSRK